MAMILTSFLVSALAPFSRTSLNHSHRPWSVSTPRVSWMGCHVTCVPPPQLLTGLPLPSIVLNSGTSSDPLGIVAAENSIALSIPPRSSLKWWTPLTCASLLMKLPFVCQSQGGSLADLGLAPAARELAQAEDHELGRLDRRDADPANALPRLDDLGRVGLRVALDEERLAGRAAEERAAAPHAREEVLRRDPQRHPQRGVVGLEDAPLRALHDGLGHVVE